MSTPQDIEYAAQLIREGKVVAFPTETVYGLGANALNAMAVARIYELKERPSFDPLIVHIASLEQLHSLTNVDDRRVKLLADRFWPGPLTIILPKSEQIPDIVTSGLQTVGIRMPDNPIALELIRRSGCPIAAPSANKFGQLSPTLARHVAKQLPEVDFILDGGPAKVGIESTIISLNKHGFEILRHGLITREEIEQVVPYYALPDEEKTNIVSPGMLKSHYSPGKPIYILDEEIPSPQSGNQLTNSGNQLTQSGSQLPNPDNQLTQSGSQLPIPIQSEATSDNRFTSDRSRIGLLSYKGNDTEGYGHVEILSPDGNLRSCAVRLFAAIHRLEEADVDFILAQPVPEQGVGLAVMDKLRKAAYRYL